MCYPGELSGLVAEASRKAGVTSRQNAGALFPAQETTLAGHSSTDGQEASAHCLPTYSISPATIISPRREQFSFPLRGLPSRCRGCICALPGSGPVKQVVGPDFLAAYAADRLEYHYCLVYRIFPSSSTKIRKDEATIFRQDLVRPCTHSMQTSNFRQSVMRGCSDLEVAAQVVFGYGPVADVTDCGSHFRSPFPVD